MRSERPSFAVDCAVVGAGVVGLAIARRLAQAGRSVLILEAEDAFGTGISSRNSEVIHGGLYYPPGSLKARLCVEGRHALYAYCAERGVTARRCGKLVVAADPAQCNRLAPIAARAAANGVDDIALIDGTAARAMEPALACAGALHSPSTGIIDSHGLMTALLGDAEDAGATLVLSSPVEAGTVTADGVSIEVGGAEPCRLDCRLVVIAAGLDSPRIAAAIEGLPASAVPQAHYAKGCYFTLRGRVPFQRLIYPVPEPGGLGVHLTLDLAGRGRFGPDVEWVDAPDYAVDPARAARFVAAIRGYWPGLPDDALDPGYAGVRPKIAGRGAPDADFRIDGPADHGIPGLVALYGIESPGLTSCLALADHVATLAAA